MQGFWWAPGQADGVVDMAVKAMGEVAFWE